jgi:hypothetical protein
MATPLQRAQSWADSITNRATPLAQVLKAGRARAWRNGDLAAFDAMTNAQKAEYHMNALWLENYRMMEAFDADQAQRDAIAASGVATTAEWAQG